MAPHPSTLAWKIPWMEEPGRLQSMESLRVRHNWANSLSFHFHALGKEMATHSSVLAWRIPGMGEPGGLLSVGLHRVGHDWSSLAAVAAAAAVAARFPMNAPAGALVQAKWTLQTNLLHITPQHWIQGYHDQRERSTTEGKGSSILGQCLEGWQPPLLMLTQEDIKSSPDLWHWPLHHSSHSNVH